MCSSFRINPYEHRPDECQVKGRWGYQNDSVGLVAGTIDESKREDAPDHDSVSS